MKEAALIPFIESIGQLLHFSKGVRKAYRLTKDGREKFALLGTDDRVLNELLEDEWVIAEEIDFTKERNEG